MDRKIFVGAANAVVIAFSIYFIYLQNTDELALYRLCKEDKIIENLQVLFFLIASGVLVELACRGNPGKFWFLALAFLLFFLAGEEISWGQRMFGVVTPEQWAQNNVQLETNVHNLKWVQRHVRSLGVLFVGALCWAIPLANKYSRPARDLFTRLRFPVLPLGTASIMTAAVGFMVFARLNDTGKAVYNFDEVGELWLSVAFFVFAVAHRISFRPSKQEI